MVVFDTSILLLVLNPKASLPRDQETNEPIPKARERIELLIKTLSDDNEKIIIPTPSLSEVLVHAGAADADYLAKLNKHACFRIAPFDQKAAVELAAILRAAIQQGDKRSGVNAPWAKVKFDRQIVAIGRAEGATAIYSDDPHVIAFAKMAGLQAFMTKDLPLPLEDPQASFDL